MYTLAKKKNFMKTYPLFDEYILDEVMRRNMLENNDLLEKYNRNRESIKTFLFELNKYQDVESIRKYIIEVIVKFPCELLQSFIAAYLNSRPEIKAREDLVNYYNKTLALGEESVRYIEKNGIIADRGYKEIPVFALNERYEELKTGEEVFKETSLDTVFYKLTLTEKKYVIEMLPQFTLLTKVLDPLEASLEDLIVLLANKNVDSKIINEDVCVNLGVMNLLNIVYYLIKLEYPALLRDAIIILINRKAYDLIDNLIKYALLEKLTMLDLNEIEYMESNNIFNSLYAKHKNLIKKEDE